MEQLQKNQSRLDYLWDNFGGRKVVDKLPDAKLLWYDYEDSNQKETYSSSIYYENMLFYDSIKDMAITSKYMYLTFPEFPEIYRLDKYNGEIIDNFEEESAELLGVIDDKLIICTNNSALYPSNTIKIQTGDDFQFKTLIDESDTSGIECLSSFNGRAMAVEGTLENGKILILSTYVDITQAIRSVLVSYKLKDGKYIGYDIYTLSDSTIEPNYKVSLDILEDNKNVIASSPFLDSSATNIEDIDFQYSLPIKVNKLEGTGINNKIRYGDYMGRGRDGVCSWDLIDSDCCIRIIYSKL